MARLIATESDGGLAAARRFVDYAEAQQISLDGLWARLDGQDRVCQTVLLVPNPGRTAMVFSGRVWSGRDVPPLAGLLRHACRATDVIDVDLAQTLLDPGETLAREAFQDGGFEPLATLSYLQRSLPRRAPSPPDWPRGVRPVPFEASRRDELLRVLDASYEDTLDCPGLRGRRRTEDILAGHRASGEFDPALWTLLLEDDRAIGTLLLNPSPAQQSVELVYLGMAPAARGRGLGTCLLRHGLRLLAGRAEQSITLAVDEQNAPALALYRREGFRPILRRLALIRSMRRSREEHATSP
ncbi:MAG: GNAT family N-acetyltransferase [Planctomycetota bacterium]